MQTDIKNFGEKLMLPDTWQSRALGLLRDGRDVVLHAPTGAGKTYVFELLMESSWRGRAVYTVPTRALANDKFREWQSRGWEVGLVTGDVRHKPDARVIVATLETQRASMLRGEGPDLFVVDEYQLLGDTQRGPAYEVTLATAPASTQLFLMSGSVSNPVDVVDWLVGHGRDVEMVSEGRRPVPLDEIFAEALLKGSREVRKGRSFLPGLVARALESRMGPILLFAPRRAASEDLARQLAIELPEVDPLELTPEQKRIAGKELANLLKRRVAYHHSGLDYLRRAGVVEPLAKAGQLRAVVATTGLAAGINFSMRTVLVTDREYRIGDKRVMLRPDELLQMYGRAGRRGLDERGYVLVTPKQSRMSEARPLKVKRSKTIDWSAMLTFMHLARSRGDSPLEAARKLGDRLFSEEQVRLGLRDSLAKVTSRKIPGLGLNRSDERDPERDQIVEMQNSAGQWERRRGQSKVSLGEALVLANDEWVPALSLHQTLDKVEVGNPCRFGSKVEKVYGREIPIAIMDEESGGKQVLLIKSFRRRLREIMTDEPPSKCRKFAKKAWRRRGLEKVFSPLFPVLASGGRLDKFVDRGGVLHARLRYEEATVLGWRDAKGKVLLNPPLRTSKREYVSPFEEASNESMDRLTNASPAEAWYRLGLIDEEGRPTRRGIVFSFFSRGEGLAIAAALEDETYPIEDLVRDLANLRAGHRFRAYSSTDCRLAYVCRQAYGAVDCPGFLQAGVPLEYGEGAADVISERAESGSHGKEVLDEELRIGDIERARIEWHSLLALTATSPSLDWSRWEELRKAASELSDGGGPRNSLPELPALAVRQNRRYEPRSSRA